MYNLAHIDLLCIILYMKIMKAYKRIEMHGNTKLKTQSRRGFQEGLKFAF
jgi:hypothetical protein